MEIQEQDKLLPASELWQALEAAGICSYSYARKWLLIQEKKGRIVYPSTRGLYDRRKFSKRQIDEIVEAFLPYGRNQWEWPGDHVPEYQS